MAVAILAILAFALRAWRLGGDLWTDEMYSVHVAQRSLAQVLADRDQTPPLFVLLLHAWMGFAGSSDVAVRIPSLVAGTLAVPLVHRIARRLVSPSGALVATAIAALAIYPIILSQEARAYAVLTTLTLASMLALMRLEESPTRARAAAYVVTTAALLYSHAYAIFPVLGQVLHVGSGLLLSPRTETRPSPSAGAPRLSGKMAMTSFAAIGLLFLPWVPRLLESNTRVASGFWIDPPKAIDAFWTVYVVTGGWFPMVAGLIVLVVALVWGARASRTARVAGARTATVSAADSVPTAASGAASISMVDSPTATAIPSRTRPLRLVALWFGVTLLVPVAVSFAHPIFTPRYEAPLAVAWILLLVAAVWRLPRTWRMAASAVLVAASIVSVSVFFAYGRLEDSRQDWTGTVATIESRAVPAAVVLFNHGSCDSNSSLDTACSYERYAHRTDLRLVAFFLEDRGLSHPVNATSVTALDAVVAGTDQAWIVYSYPNDRERLIPQRLVKDGFVEVGHWDLKRIELIQFQRIEHAPAASAVAPSG